LVQRPFSYYRRTYKKRILEAEDLPKLPTGSPSSRQESGGHNLRVSPLSALLDRAQRVKEKYFQYKIYIRKIEQSQWSRKRTDLMIASGIGFSKGLKFAAIKFCCRTNILQSGT